MVLPITRLTIVIIMKYRDRETNKRSRRARIRNIREGEL